MICIPQEMFWTSWNCFGDLEGYIDRLARCASYLPFVRIVCWSGQRGEWWWGVCSSRLGRISISFGGYDYCVLGISFCIAVSI
jgi:hypothetical protein